MQVTVTEKGQATIVGLQGEVDMFNSPHARKALQGAVKQKRNPVIVNLADVSYIDSSGVATLIECLRGVKGYSGKLILVGVNADIRDVFRIARLADVFEIHETEEKALEAGVG